MKLRDALLAAAIPATTVAHQRVIAHTADTVETMPPTFDMGNTTETITRVPSPAGTGVPDKPALQASMMGLIVFSAAGLVLL